MKQLFSFSNLYTAHLAARKGKRGRADVIAFEMDMARALWNLKNRLDNNKYGIRHYKLFNIYEPKKREIQALKYSDRVVLHCLCDNYLTFLFERLLIYDNAACRKGKGTHFAQNRLSKFMQEHYKEHKNKGYILKVDIRKYNVIYKAVEEIQLAMEGMLKPDTKEEIIASVEVRNTFKVPKIGTIAGCYVQSGTVKRSATVHVIREGIVVHSGKIASLKRFKDDAREVAAGYECGIGLDGFDDLQVGDQFEVIEIIEIARKLSAAGSGAGSGGTHQ